MFVVEKLRRELYGLTISKIIDMTAIKNFAGLLLFTVIFFFMTDNIFADNDWARNEKFRTRKLNAVWEEAVKVCLFIRLISLNVNVHLLYST
jgi:hypothetical protein